MIVNIVSPHASYYLGGMEVVTLQMARRLAHHGVSVRLFVRQTNIPSDIYQYLISQAENNLKVIEIPLPADTPLADSTWPTFYRIACDFGMAAQPFYTEQADADLFITHLSIDSLFIPKTSKIVLHLHGTPTTVDPLMEAAVELPIATIAHSHSIKEWWQARFPSLNPIVFQNGIDTSFFNGSPINERPIDILYVGRFMDHKGIDDILHAVHPGQKVVVAGNGPYLSALKSIVRERRLLNSVVFYDTPSTKMLQNLYRQAKIFACPSHGREGLLTTLLEAGSSGCAIITTSGSGMTDLIENNVNGIVVTPSIVTELKYEINKLLKNSDQRITLATALQSEITARWSWDQKSEELRDIYDSIL